MFIIHAVIIVLISLSFGKSQDSPCTSCAEKIPQCCDGMRIQCTSQELILCTKYESREYTQRERLTSDKSHEIILNHDDILDIIPEDKSGTTQQIANPDGSPLQGFRVKYDDDDSDNQIQEIHVNNPNWEDAGTEENVATYQNGKNINKWQQKYQGNQEIEIHLKESNEELSQSSNRYLSNGGSIDAPTQGKIGAEFVEYQQNMGGTGENFEYNEENQDYGTLKQNQMKTNIDYKYEGVLCTSCAEKIPQCCKGIKSLCTSQELILCTKYQNGEYTQQERLNSDETHEIILNTDTTSDILTNNKYSQNKIEFNNVGKIENEIYNKVVDIGNTNVEQEGGWGELSGTTHQLTNPDGSKSKGFTVKYGEESHSDNFDKSQSQKLEINHQHWEDEGTEQNVDAYQNEMNTNKWQQNYQESQNIELAQEESNKAIWESLNRYLANGGSIGGQIQGNVGVEFKKYPLKRRYKPGKSGLYFDTSEENQSYEIIKQNQMSNKMEMEDNRINRGVLCMSCAEKMPQCCIGMKTQCTSQELILCTKYESGGYTQQELLGSDETQEVILNTDDTTSGLLNKIYSQDKIEYNDVIGRENEIYTKLGDIGNTNVEQEGGWGELSGTTHQLTNPDGSKSKGFTVKYGEESHSDNFDKSQSQKIEINHQHWEDEGTEQNVATDQNEMDTNNWQQKYQENQNIKLAQEESNKAIWESLNRYLSNGGSIGGQTQVNVGVVFKKYPMKEPYKPGEAGLYFDNSEENQGYEVFEQNEMENREMKMKGGDAYQAQESFDETEYGYDEEKGEYAAGTESQWAQVGGGTGGKDMIGLQVHVKKTKKKTTVKEDACLNNPCGINTQCTSIDGRAICQCAVGFFGNPFIVCKLGKCMKDHDCNDEQACKSGQCVNLCNSDDACGINALCKMQNHEVVCSCAPGFTGNPFLSCRQIIPADVCVPNTCGANTICRVIAHKPHCQCIPGYIGEPETGCRHECEHDVECSKTQACINFKCQNPCKLCGRYALCESVAVHKPVCKCPQDYFGNPYVSCRPECLSHEDCPRTKPTCTQFKCVNPCDGACGVLANCEIRGTEAACSCPTHLTGNPLQLCRPYERKDFCEPNPCGRNTRCDLGLDIFGAYMADCKCLPGFYNHGVGDCFPGECADHDHCPSHKACVDFMCQDACDGQCGIDSHCEALNHTAVCSCPPGYDGNPLVLCEPEKPCTNIRVCGKAVQVKKENLNMEISDTEMSS